MIRVESKGSFWLLDPERAVYFRFPKAEAPREPVEWGGPEAGVLQDAVPHPFVSWSIEQKLVAGAVLGPRFYQQVLAIELEDGHVVRAPDARVLSEVGS